MKKNEKNKILKGSPPISVLLTDDINAALCSKIEETANVSQKSELQTLLPTVKAILRVCSFCEHSSKVWQGTISAILLDMPILRSGRKLIKVDSPLG